MARLIVAVEGVKFGDGRMLKPGAIQVPNKKIPVLWNGNHTQVVGTASDPQRDGNKLTMEITLDEDIYLDLEDEIETFVYLQPFVGQKQGDELLITNGTLRSVSLRDSILSKETQHGP